jgi:hypothetical protein
MRRCDGGRTRCSASHRSLLRQALQARWEDSLKERAKIDPHSPVPLLDEPLTPFRDAADPHPTAPTATVHQLPTRDDREKMISPIPPKSKTGLIPNVG